MRFKLLFLLLLFFFSLHGQQFNATVVVNADRISASANPVFENLQQSMENFLNQTNWNNQNLEDHQKINCQVSLIITDAVDFTRFSGNLQIQASRPVYGSTYTTTILNFQDADVDFVFNEFQALNYNENRLSNNLEAVLAYYAFFVLRLDQISFSNEEDNSYLDTLENLVNLAQQNGYSGWANRPSELNRFTLLRCFNSPSQAWYTNFWYVYHRDGLDQLYKDDSSVNAITEQLEELGKQSRSRNNNFLKRLFFDSKMDEIVSIYKNQDDEVQSEVVQILSRNAPSYQSIWSQIKE